MLISQFSRLDLILADFYFDPAQANFPWKEHWFAEQFMHRWVKYILITSGLCITVLAASNLLASHRMKPPTWHMCRGRGVRLRILALAAILTPLMIAFIKAHSALHCPTKLVRYGGEHSFLRLLDHLPEGWSAGRCFPAGHASAGMWLAALAVFWLPHAPRTATWVFICGLTFGSGLGWVQQMRGQHFLSHTLWTAWLSGALILALIALHARQLNEPVPQFTATPHATTPVHKKIITGILLGLVLAGLKLSWFER